MYVIENNPNACHQCGQVPGGGETVYTDGDIRLCEDCFMEYVYKHYEDFGFTKEEVTE